MSISITCFPRIHITLIGLSKEGYRINGGIGFSIDDPKILLKVNQSSSFNFIDNRIYKIDEKSLLKIKNVIDEVVASQSFRKNIQIEVSGNAYSHYGLGLGTILTLACIESLYITNQKEYTVETIVSQSKRGGTSGIGINTYFNGGLAFDIGRKSSPIDIFKSSDSYSDVNILPSLVGNYRIPENWKIGLCIPEIDNIEIQKEANFFNTICPIPLSDVKEVLYHSIYGVLGSIIDADLENFSISVNNIQNCYWKYNERQLHGEQLKDFENELKYLGAKAIGMSSLGPSLFFLSDNIEDVCNKLNNKYGRNIAIVTNSTNKGREIVHD